MKNSAKQTALSVFAFIIGISLTGCGNANQSADKADVSVTTTTTTANDQATETTTVKSEDGTSTSVVTSDGKNDDKAGEVDAVIKTGDGESLSIHSKKNGTGGGDVQIEGPGGIVINASGGDDGDSKVEIKGLGKFSLKAKSGGKEKSVKIDTEEK